MPRLTPRSLLALALIAPAALLGCDFPMPASGGAAPSLPLPDMAEATVIEGTLEESDGRRRETRYQDAVTTVAVPPGATLAVVMDSEAFDPFLAVGFAGDQEIINDDWQGSRQRSAVVQANTSGQTIQARILASAFAPRTGGPYTVRVLVQEPPPAPTGPPLAAGQNGTLTAETPTYPLTSGDAARRADVYGVTLAAGERLTVRMTSEAFDTYLKVLRDGAFHARNDDFGGSRGVSQITLTGPGAFTVLAGTFTASGEGAYALTASRGEAPAPEATAPEATAPGVAAPEADASTPATPLPTASGAAGGRTVEGEITDGDSEVPLTIAGDARKADGYNIRLEAGQTVEVEMTSESFDTYLKLVRGEDAVARNDDAGSTRRSAFRYTASTAGQYTLFAGTFSSSGRGAYTLTWRVVD